MPNWSLAQAQRHQMKTAAAHNFDAGVGQHTFVASGKEANPERPAEVFHTTTKPLAMTKLEFHVFAEPMGAPRMTRRDKWLKPRRECVSRYFALRDHIQAVVGDIPTVPDEVQTRFFISMPDSWSKRKQASMCGQPHRQRPDKDNLEKCVLDAIFLEDGAVWKGSQEKFWCESGKARIEIVMIWRGNE